MGLLTYGVHPAGSTGTGRAYIQNLQDARRLEAEIIVSAVGGTPTASFQVEGLRIGGDPTVNTDWITLATIQGDSTIAATNSAITVSAVGKTYRYVDGLDKRFFDAFAINCTANTNVTYQTNLNRAD